MPAKDHPLHEALFHYYAEFDAEELLRSFAVIGVEPRPDVVQNFLGVSVPPKVFPPVLDGLVGHVEGIPSPGNWHADIAEWASALNAVAHAKETFRIIELGCGWGCWLVNTGVAARSRGLEVELIGVEGDKGHLGNAAETLALNGFGPADYRLHHGVAAPRAGKAIFPDPEAGTAGWGGEAIFYPDAQTLARAEADPAAQVLDCLPLAGLCGEAPVDLLHIDIQGAEADFVEGNLDSMQAYVRRVLIGTHGRVIEGRLMGVLLDAGWRLEMERPAIAPPSEGIPRIAIDGVQCWVNSELG